MVLGSLLISYLGVGQVVTIKLEVFTVSKQIIVSCHTSTHGDVVQEYSTMEDALQWMALCVDNDVPFTVSYK